MAKHLSRKVSLFMVFVLSLLSISGCVVRGQSSITLNIENSNHLISDTDKMYIRYEDGSSSAAADLSPTSVSGDVYVATTDSTKTIVGGYVSDGIVNWVPKYSTNGFSNVIYSTYNPITWGKPTIPAVYATVNNVVYGLDEDENVIEDRIEVTFDVYGTDHQMVDGRTEVFLQSANPDVIINPDDPARGYSSFTEYGTGSVMFEILASTLDISSLELGLMSGPNDLPIHVPITSLSVTSNSSTLYVGESLQMSAELLPITASNKAVDWSVADGTETASVNTAGLLTGISAGTVTVKATATDGSEVYGTKTITITVLAPTSILVTEIQVASNGNLSSIVTGQTIGMSANVIPANASNKVVTWTVVNGTGKASIDSSTGVLTAGNSGSVTVIATATDGSNTLGTINLTIIAAPTSPPTQGNTSAPTVSPTPTPVATVSPTPAPTASLAPTTTPTPNEFMSDIVDLAKEISTIQSLVEKANNSTVEVKLADVQGHWAEKTVETFIKLGVIQGYGNNKFNPDGNITRAEFATILTKIFSMETGTKSVGLSDVNKHWAKAAIEKLASLGVLGGYSDGTFKPDRTISREEMIIIISRIVNLTPAAEGVNSSTFTDVDDSYAKDALNDAIKAGIISGKGNNKIEPKSKATRAEALTIVLNTLNLNPQIKTLLAELN